MRRGLGRYVLEDERLLVLMDDLGGNLASDDPAEQALLQQGNYILIALPGQGPPAPPMTWVHWQARYGTVLNFQIIIIFNR